LIIVTKFSINTGDKIHLPGDSISGLSKKEEQDLVHSGHCRYPDVVVADSKPSTDELPEGLKDLGKGNFELSNGEKVRGKAKAIAEQEKLNAEVQKPDGEPPVDPNVDPDGPKTDLPV
jgi:hypothetical protein